MTSCQRQRPARRFVPLSGCGLQRLCSRPCSRPRWPICSIPCSRPEHSVRRSVYPFELFMNSCPRSSEMTSKTAARRQSDGETNPKIDPAPNSNTEKEPDDWVSGNDPMTGAQASYLKPFRKRSASRTLSTPTSPRPRRRKGSTRSSQSEVRRLGIRNEPRVRQGNRQ